MATLGVFIVSLGLIGCGQNIDQNLALGNEATLADRFGTSSNEGFSSAPAVALEGGQVVLANITCKSDGTIYVSGYGNHVVIVRYDDAFNDGTVDITGVGN